MIFYRVRTAGERVIDIPEHSVNFIEQFEKAPPKINFCGQSGTLIKIWANDTYYWAQPQSEMAFENCIREIVNRKGQFRNVPQRAFPEP